MDKRKAAVLVACFFTVLMAYSIRYGYGVLLPDMLPSLAISKTEAGVIFASFFLAYTVFSPVVGLLGDKHNVRVLLSLFAVMVGAGTFLMAYAASLVQAALFFTLVGVGSAACWAPVMALAQRWTSDKHRGKTLAFVDIGSALGIVVSSTALPPLVAAHSWRTGWIALGALGFAVAVLNFFLVRSRPAGSAPAGPSGSLTPAIDSVRTTYSKLLRDGRFWRIGLAYLLTGFAIIIPFTFLTTYAEKELSFIYNDAARLVMVIGISAVVGKIALGSLSDRTRRINIMLLCALLIAAGALGMAFSRGFTLVLFITVFGVGYGAVWSMYAASASDYFSRESAGSIVGLWTLYLGIGSAVSPVIAGWLADATGTLAWSFVLAAAGAAVSFLLLISLWRQPRESRVKTGPS
ncbi:MAG: hypothetical protein A2Z29_06185 [Chloroflexi bacterium RBG_16_56_11]|nr:MAG: hypothetical protein A2Z29_06185 [Chloroflexi bacterium RBG_16_56_11]